MISTVLSNITKKLTLIDVSHALTIVKYVEIKFHASNVRLVLIYLKQHVNNNVKMDISQMSKPIIAFYVTKFVEHVTTVDQMTALDAFQERC